MRYLVFVLMMMAAVAPAAAADKFDLKCSGTKTEKLDAPGAPVSFTLHIDLAAKQYCRNQCEQVLPIFDVKPDKITFHSDSTKDRRMSIYVEDHVDRKSGSYERVMIETYPTSFYEKTSASCKPAAFTPFPKTMF